jgi:hypothetical protein
MIQWFLIILTELCNHQHNPVLECFHHLKIFPWAFASTTPAASHSPKSQDSYWSAFCVCLFVLAVPGFWTQVLKHSTTWTQTLVIFQIGSHNFFWVGGHELWSSFWGTALEFELRASCLLCRHLNTSATPPVLFWDVFCPDKVLRTMPGTGFEL